MSLPGGSPVAGSSWPTVAGAGEQAAPASQEQSEAVERQLRRFVRRVSKRFPAFDAFTEEIDDLLITGAAEPVVDVLLGNPLLQLGLAAVGVVVERLPQSGGGEVEGEVLSKKEGVQ